MAKDTRIKRAHFQVLLDYGNELHEDAMRDLKRFSKARKFTSWILDMWRLWDDLAKGGTSILVELFPAFTERLTKNSDDKMLEQIAGQLAAIIAKLENGTVPITGKVIQSKNIPMPTFDDEDTIVLGAAQLSTDDMLKQAMNLINSAIAVQGRDE